jgi:alpha-tubulin suppressor-like RCC1 family protein
MKYLSSLLILLMFFSCENSSEKEETSKVQFSFSNEVRSKASAADAKSIVISIEQSGTPVYDKVNLTLFDFNGSMVTTPLALPVGNYSITEFFVLDSLDSVIFATPLEGSALANLVTDPLPIEFSVISNQTVTVNPQVISTESNNPSDFGFFGLGFGIVETFDFLVSVQIFENGAFTLATATIDVESDGHLDYSQTIPNTITTIKARDIAAAIYTVTISKDGYEDYQQYFTRDSLLTFAASPLTVVLNKDNATVVNIFAGVASSFILKSDNSLWATGQNYTQLGDGTFNSRNTFIKVLTDVSSVSSNEFHTLAIKTDGSLWGTGYNLGFGDATNPYRNTFAQIMTNVSAVSAGQHSSLVLKTNGSLWVAGKNEYGELGNGTNTANYTFSQVMTGVSSISAGYYHSLVVKTDGSLWATGANPDGRLGDGTNTFRNSFSQVLTGVQFASAGAGHSMALKTDGTLWATGSNYFGELGDGTNVQKTTFIQVATNVNKIAAGATHSFFLLNNGTLYGTGSVAYGALGNGTNSVWQNTFVQITSNVSMISAGNQFSLLLKNDGSYWGTGRNTEGQYGNGNNTEEHAFTIISL